VDAERCRRAYLCGVDPVASKQLKLPFMADLVREASKTSASLGELLKKTGTSNTMHIPLFPSGSTTGTQGQESLILKEPLQSGK
jgi:hypothetical protein